MRLSWYLFWGLIGRHVIERKESKRVWDRADEGKLRLWFRASDCGAMEPSGWMSWQFPPSPGRLLNWAPPSFLSLSFFPLGSSCRNCLFSQELPAALKRRESQHKGQLFFSTKKEREKRDDENWEEASNSAPLPALAGRPRIYNSLGWRVLLFQLWFPHFNSQLG